MKATLSSLALGEHRTSRRRIVNFGAALNEEGATTLHVSVSDVSEGGCRLFCEQPVDQNSELWLKLPGLEARRVRIVWANERDFGCEFDTRLYSGEIETLDPSRSRATQKEVFRR